MEYGPFLNEKTWNLEIEKQIAAFWRKKNPFPFNAEEDGFFKELIKNMTEEGNDFDKVNSWYNKKFLSEDLVYQMKDYWAKQNPQIILNNLNTELKNKLLSKINKLHQLEKDWRSSYFNLITKEEEIRKEEKELKESLGEFISIYKRNLERKKK